MADAHGWPDLLGPASRSLPQKPSCKEFRRPHCARRRVSERNRREAADLGAEMATE